MVLKYMFYDSHNNKTYWLSLRLWRIIKRTPAVADLVWCVTYRKRFSKLSTSFLSSSVSSAITGFLWNPFSSPEVSLLLYTLAVSHPPWRAAWVQTQDSLSGWHHNRPPHTHIALSRSLDLCAVQSLHLSSETIILISQRIVVKMERIFMMHSVQW